MTTLRQLLLALPLLFSSAALAQPASPAIVVNHEYDAMGNPTRRLVAPGSLNLATQTEYDRLQRPRRITDARAGRIELDYLGGSTHLRQLTDPRALITQYERTGLGSTTLLSSPDTATTSYTLDAAGNVRTRVDARGVVAQQSYDALNRLTSIVYSDGSRSASYSWIYDETGPGFSNGVGRLTTALHPQGFSRYAYDAQGRVVAHTQRVSDTLGTSSLTATVGYQYDAAGRLVRIAYPSGRLVTIAHTGGRPSAISAAESAGVAAVPLVSQIVSTPSGALTGWLWHTDAGTLAHPRVLDLQERPLRYRLGPWMRDLQYDAAGRITSYTHTDAVSAQRMPGLDQFFGYDELGRLTWFGANGTMSLLSYDANGNRTAVHSGAVTSSYTTAINSNRLLTTSQPPRLYSHDAAGNTVGYGAPNARMTTLAYDLAGRLAAFVPPLSLPGDVIHGSSLGIPGAADYVVDGLGRRVLKTTWPTAAVGGPGPSAARHRALRANAIQTSETVQVTAYVYDEAGQLLGEYDGTSGMALREYAWLGSTPVAMFARNEATGAWETFHIHADHLGAPRAVLDRANRLRWSWFAEPFGTTAPNSNPGGVGALTFNLRLPGQYFDSESGLHYNYHRDYDPSVGRYVQSDSVGLAGGINTYAYVENQPTKYVDPTGEAAAAALCLVPGVGWVSCGATATVIVVGCALSTGCRQIVLGSSGRIVGPPGRIAAPPSNSSDQCKEDERKQECENKRKQDENLCLGVAKPRYGSRGYAVCMSSAMERYSECLRSGVGGIRTPLAGVETML